LGSAVEPATERDFFWEFVLAEFHSYRWRNSYRLGLTRAASSALQRATRKELGDSDWESLRNVLISYRRPIIEDVLQLEPVWRYEQFSIADLPSVKFMGMGMDDFIRVAPNHTLNELALAHRAGSDTNNDWFVNGLNYLLMDYDPRRTRGVPIFLSEGGGSPFILIEGLTRSTAVVFRTLTGQPVPQELRVLIGVSPALRTWRRA
jgi:hypothetical protein